MSIRRRAPLPGAADRRRGRCQVEGRPAGRRATQAQARPQDVAGLERLRAEERETSGEEMTKLRRHPDQYAFSLPNESELQ